MTKKDIIEALKYFADDDVLSLNCNNVLHASELHPRVICGNRQWGMAYHCILLPNHEGECYCGRKDVDFVPDKEKTLDEFLKNN